jgi:hypothetical protein
VAEILLQGAATNDSVSNQHALKKKITQKWLAPTQCLTHVSSRVSLVFKPTDLVWHAVAEGISVARIHLLRAGAVAHIEPQLLTRSESLVTELPVFATPHARATQIELRFTRLESASALSRRSL